MITKKHVQAMFPSHTVTQYGSKQLFKACRSDETIFISYLTVIGRLTCDGLILDDVYYSPTTARHKLFLRRQYRA